MHRRSDGPVRTEEVVGVDSLCRHRHSREGILQRLARQDEGLRLTAGRRNRAHSRSFGVAARFRCYDRGKDEVENQNDDEGSSGVTIQ